MDLASHVMVANVVNDGMAVVKMLKINKKKLTVKISIKCRASKTL